MQLTGGNPVVGPETGHTTTVGLVLQPAFAPRFSLSLDYYDIKVTDYIGTLAERRTSWISAHCSTMQKCAR